MASHKTLIPARKKAASVTRREVQWHSEGLSRETVKVTRAGARNPGQKPEGLLSDEKANFAV